MAVAEGVLEQAAKLISFSTDLTLRCDGIQEVTSNNGVIIDSLQIKDGAVVLLPQHSVAAGTDQATATNLGSPCNNWLQITGADGTTGVALPIGDDSGATFIVLFNDSASSLKVYPAVGETINALSANAPFIQSAHSIVIYCATVTSAWRTVPNGGTAAMTAGLTAITHTAPTPDYAIQNLTQATPYGFADIDEGNTVLSVILNLQTQMAEVKAILIGAGLVPVA